MTSTFPSRSLSLVVALSLCGCDPTATRLTAQRLDFVYATSARSFDLDGNLVLTGWNAPRVVRLDRQRLEFQDLSQGLPDGGFPAGEILADARGNLAAGGLYRGVGDAQWRALAEPPPGAFVYTLDGAGTVYAVSNGQPSRLYRLQPPDGAWESMGEFPAVTNLDWSTFRARRDGTLFIGGQVWAKGATSAVPLVECPTLRIDQGCERGFSVLTHPRRDEAWLVAEPNPGVSKGLVYRLSGAETFPLEYDALTAVAVPEGRWRAVRMSSDAVLHVAWLQQVSIDYPPYEVDEATLYALDASGAKAEARLLWGEGPVVGDHRDIYQATTQLVGGVWVADPVYVWKF